MCGSFVALLPSGNPKSVSS